MSTEELTEELLLLPLEERVALAEALWASIKEGPNTGVTNDEQEAIAQARRRDAELTSRAAPARSHEQVMRAVRRALGCE